MRQRPQNRRDERAHKERADLVAARDDATEQSRLKSEFIATVSHEIRTPMNGVIGLASLLHETDLDETQRSFVDGILESGEALLHILDETLDFSKLEAGKIELERVDFALVHVIESVATLVSVSAQAKGLTVLTEIARQGPMDLRGDAGRLRQVLFNLLSNAVKFTESGAVTVRVSSAAHHVLPTATVAVEVEDTGVGIVGDPARLFEPFAQASAKTARRYGGTGLGLAICARLVGAMGGTITVTSRPGEGSTFRFEVPFALATTASPEAATIGKTGEPQRNMRSGIVLIVDDNGINRLVAGQMVVHLGYSCDTAVNGLEALEMLGPRRYLAVLMDCFMPIMDGFDATAELRAREGDVRHTPVIATTAGALDGDRGHCEAVGMDDFVTKPLTLDRLGAALDRVAS